MKNQKVNKIGNIIRNYIRYEEFDKVGKYWNEEGISSLLYSSELNSEEKSYLESLKYIAEIFSRKRDLEKRLMSTYLRENTSDIIWFYRRARICISYCKSRELFKEFKLQNLEVELKNLYQIFLNKINPLIQKEKEAKEWTEFRKRLINCIELLKISYSKLIDEIILKNGQPDGNYFLTERCASQNKKIKREGYQIHHIDENLIELLSKPEIAIENPWKFQTGKRLVYVNLFEHFLLHCRIYLETSLSVGGIVAMTTYHVRRFQSRYNFRNIEFLWQTLENQGHKLEDFNFLLWIVYFLKPNSELENYCLTLRTFDDFVIKKIIEEEFKKINKTDFYIVEKNIDKFVSLKYYKSPNKTNSEHSNFIRTVHKFEPYDYQLEAIERAKKTQQFLLSLEVGAGKTYTSALIIESWMIDNLLIIAPKQTLKQWQEYFPENINEKMKIKIVNVEWAYRNAIELSIYKNIVVDEMQILKNPQSATFNSLKKILIESENLLLVSGSPLNWEQKAKDWFNTWKLLYKNLNTYTEFKKSYEIKENYWQAWLYILEGISRKSFFYKIDHTNKKISKEIIIKSTDSFKKALIEFKDKEGRFLYDWPMAYQIAIKTHPDSLTEKGKELSIISQSIDSLVIFYTFNKEKEIIKESLHHEIFEISGEKNDFSSFSNCQTKKAILIQQKAGGVGLDGLQKQTNHIIFFSIPMTLDSLVQQTGRVFRNGQNEDVTTYFLMSEPEKERFTQFKLKYYDKLKGWF